MKIAIAGATGFVGAYLSKHLSGQGHEIIPISKDDFTQHNVSFKIHGCDAVLNFTGTPILRRWNEKAREKITESRVGTTSTLVHTISVINHPPKLLINASAVGFYSDEQIQTEKNFRQGHGAISNLVEKWEDEAIKGIYSGTRVVILRLGIVLGNNGGIIKKLSPFFRKGLGGTIGNGKQMMSFIHIEDLARAVDFFIQNESCNDVYNLTTPYPVSNKVFSKKLAAAFGKKLFLPVPSILLKIMYGEASSFLLEGQEVLPERITECGFIFKFPDLDSCLKDIIL